MNHKLCIFIVFIALIMAFCGCSPGRPGPAQDPGPPSSPTTPSLPDTVEPTPTEPSPEVPDPPWESPEPEDDAKETLKPGMELFQKGHDALKEGNYAVAMKCFNEALTENPQLDKAHAWRGRVYFEMQDYQKARQDLEKALSLNPDNADAQLFMGNLFSRNEDEEAINYYSRAIILNENNAEALYRRGAEYLHRGRNNLARQDLEKVLELNPDPEIRRLTLEKLKSMGKTKRGDTR